MKLKTQLLSLMNQHRINAAELSRRSGVSKQVLSLWLAGSEPKRIEQVQKVARVFEVSIDELCFGECVDSIDKADSKNITSLFGSEWITGTYEVKLRRVK